MSAAVCANHENAKITTANVNVDLSLGGDVKILSNSLERWLGANGYTHVICYPKPSVLKVG